MNRKDAILAMINGAKMTHSWFSPEEWVRIKDHRFEFEDGCMCEPEEFWRIRDDESWQEGWKIFEPPKTNQ